MKTKKFATLVRMHYACHGVQVKLKFIGYVRGADRYIYRLKLKPGTKENKIFTCAPDIQLALRLPLFQPYRRGQNIYLAVSRKQVRQNSLATMLTSQDFRRYPGALPIALGYDSQGAMFFADLAAMPHGMYAGASNSGKSAGLTSLICSLTYRLPASKVNLILFDVGANSMNLFDSLPHLAHSIVKDSETGVYVLKALVNEMERRIQLESCTLRELPAIVCVIDEYISLICNIEDKVQSQEVAGAITNLLRRGRHAKMHVVLATQDPSRKKLQIDVGNITARVAFKCATYYESLTILNEVGAEKLAGRGDMLFKSSEHPNPIRLQGAYMPPEQVEELVARIKARDRDLSNKFLISEFEEVEPLESASSDCSSTGNRGTEELAEIIMWVLTQDTVSANQLMKQFSMGNRAYAIAQELTDMGVITEQFANQPRKVLLHSVEDVPESVMHFLQSNGIPVDDVEVALQSKPMGAIVPQPDDPIS